MSVERILIVNLTRFGDLLQTSPTVAALAARHPGATITLVAERNFADVCDGIPGIDRVYRMDLDRLGRRLLEGGAGVLDAYRDVERAVAELRAARFELALNFSSSRMSAVFMGLLGVPDVRGWSMTPDGLRVIRHPWARLFATLCLHRRVAAFNLVDSYRAMAGDAGAARRLRYVVAPADRERAAALLAAEGVRAEERPIALQLGASRAIRAWPPAAFGELGRRLVAAGRRVVLVGGAGDRPVAAAVAAAIGAGVIDACGRTGVGELAALLARAALLVTGDTGPMHMAVAVGTPVVGLFFGPASPFDTGPYGADHVVLESGAPCAPCGHHLTCLDPFCRDAAAPETVAAAVALRLAGDWDGLGRLAAASTPLRVYRTGFDGAGFHRCERLGGVPPRHQDLLREAYRATWLAVLEGIRPPAAPIGTLDTGPFRALAALAREGAALAAALAAEAAGAAPDLEALERRGRALEAVDGTIAEHAAVHPDVAVLARMFRFGKENLEGDGVAALAAETGALYEALALEADLMTALLGGAERKEGTSDARLHQ